MYMKYAKFLNGKKTTIGAVVFFCLYGALGVHLIDQATFDSWSRLAELIVGVGLAHKIMKQV
jgi:hypothetical protein